MEQGRTGLKGGHAATVCSPGALSAQNKNNRFERQKKDSVYIAVHDIGVDLMTATGGAKITYDHLLALQFRGYLDYSPDDIFNSHYDDLDDLNTDIQFGYNQRLENTAVEEARLLAEMESTELPSLLFRKVDFVAIEGLSSKRKLKNGNTALNKDIGVITDDEIEGKERVYRYARYALAKKLLQQVRSNVNERRLVGIALGIFLGDEDSEDGGANRQGKRISSYQSEIYKASNSAITQADVEIAAEREELYEFVYPERRAEYFKRLKQAAEEPVIVPLKDVKQLYPIITPEVSIDVSRKRLLLGEAAVKAVLEGGTKPSSVHKLGELLLQKAIDQRFGIKGSFRDWQKHEYLQYGEWLLQLLKPFDGQLTEDILMNGFKLGIGPSLGYIEVQFDSSPNFYRQLTLSKKNAPGQYNDMTHEQIITYIQQVASINGDRVSVPILREYYYQQKAVGNDVPSYQTLAKVANKKIGELIEEAGFKIISRKLDATTCAKAAARFYLANDRWPMVKDLPHIEGMPSWPTVRLYCGNMAGLKHAGEKYLENLNQDEDVTAVFDELEEEPLAA